MSNRAYSPVDNIEDARQQIVHNGREIVARSREKLVPVTTTTVGLAVAGLVLVIALHASPLVELIIPVLSFVVAVCITLVMALCGTLRLGRAMADMSRFAGYTDDQIVDYVNRCAYLDDEAAFELRATYDREHETARVTGFIEERVAHYTRLGIGLCSAGVLLGFLAFTNVQGMITWFNHQHSSVPLMAIMILMLAMVLPIMLIIGGLSCISVIRNLRKRADEVRRGRYSPLQLFEIAQRYTFDHKLGFPTRPSGR